MSLFVEQVATTDDNLHTLIKQALQADKSKADDPAEVDRHVAAVKQAKAGTSVYKWNRIIIALVIGGVLLAVGICLAIYGDSWTAAQALKAATTSGYVAPKSSLPAIATSFIAMGSAWSGGVVSAVLGGKSSS
jgi:hypothetical protein